MEISHLQSPRFSWAEFMVDTAGIQCMFRSMLFIQQLWKSFSSNGLRTWTLNSTEEKGSVENAVTAGFMKTFIMIDRFICNATNSMHGPLLRDSVSREQPNIVFFHSVWQDEQVFYSYSKWSLSLCLECQF